MEGEHLTMIEWEGRRNRQETNILQDSATGENLAPRAFPQTCELFNVQICKPDSWA